MLSPRWFVLLILTRNGYTRLGVVSTLLWVCLPCTCTIKELNTTCMYTQCSLLLQCNGGGRERSMVEHHTKHPWGEPCQPITNITCCIIILKYVKRVSSEHVCSTVQHGSEAILMWIVSRQIPEDWSVYSSTLTWFCARIRTAYDMAVTMIAIYTLHLFFPLTHDPYS